MNDGSSSNFSHSISLRQRKIFNMFLTVGFNPEKMSRYNEEDNIIEFIDKVDIIEITRDLSNDQIEEGVYDPNSPKVIEENNITL